MITNTNNLGYADKNRKILQTYDGSYVGLKQDFIDEDFFASCVKCYQHYVENNADYIDDNFNVTRGIFYTLSKADEEGFNWWVSSGELINVDDRFDESEECYVVFV